MSIGRLFSVLGHHWLLVTTLTAALVGGVAAVTFTTVSSYRASALLQVQAPVDATGVVSLQDTLTARERAVTIVSLGNTAQVGKLAAKKIGPGAGLEQCGFAQVAQSEFLTAACSGTHQNVVAAAANAYAAALQQLLDTQREERVAQLGAAYRAQIATLKAQGVPATNYPPPAVYQSYRELSLIDSAVTPTSPFSPRPMRTLAIALVLGLLLNTGLAFLLERFQDLARGSDELRRALGEPVLVAIPKLSRGSASDGLAFAARRPPRQKARAQAGGRP